MINRTENVDCGASVDEKFRHHFCRKGFSAESMLCLTPLLTPLPPDVKFHTTDGRTLILSRYTEPDTDHKLLLEQLKLTLPPQPPSRITAGGQRAH